MVKLKASNVWHKGIKYRDKNGGFDFIARLSTIGATVYYKGQGMTISAAAGELILSAGPGGKDFHEYGLSVAEKIIEDDVFFLCHKDGGRVKHNQKLAAGYKIGDALVQTGTGVWTIADDDTVGHELYRLGFLVGPADRVTSEVLKGIDDAFSATEPADILM